MKQQHVINKQIIEVHLSKKEDTFAMQQKVSALYREQFVPIIDTLLTNHFGKDIDTHYQIDALVIDLGEVSMNEVVSVFTQKLKQALSNCNVELYSEDSIPVTIHHHEQTPLKILTYYLTNGRLPWWASETTKDFLWKQLDQLIQKPIPDFKILLKQLQEKNIYVDRFLDTFSEKQCLQSLQILTDFSIEQLVEVKKDLFDQIIKTNSSNNINNSYATFAKTFWRTAFNTVHTAETYAELKESCIQHTLLEFGMPIDHQNKEKNDIDKEIKTIRVIIVRLQSQYPKDKIWQQFLERMDKVTDNPSFYHADIDIKKKCKQLLFDVEAAQQVTTEHIQQLEIVSNIISDQKYSQIGKGQSQFDEVDFITVQNAGLVLLWPFLQRFFENLNLLEEKTFPDTIASTKAMWALQYLCNEDEETFFEGMFPLVKILCGVAIEDPISMQSLSTEEKEIAEGLLHAVINQGPHWKNLSLDGFRTSYLMRQGSLRIHHDHWLLQVQKETYDVTLEKLPWGITVVKLPWMPNPLMVEWI
ncbi:contractile injection system tape measure protein [Aquimarina algicola]|uniref:Uncharacterized protein n=1 Tax=Aquimarina algicola TaxID=2589995 RepID=A0A504JJQ4_9FLAO|nr:contractile injection system tape measure protein [Aquimarina algicola]TPN86989.1 hypothetical protein FHK87_05200 [Aquimarina algicola]